MLNEKEKNISNEQQKKDRHQISPKRIFVPAGVESTLISKSCKGKLPKTGEYTIKTKVFSPNSRGM